MGLCWRTALRAPGPPDREAREGRSKEGKDRAEVLGTNQDIGSMARLIVGTRHAVPLRSHLEHPLHTLFPVAFEEKQFLIAIDRERTRRRRGERELHGLPGRDLFLDRKGGLGIVDDYVVRHQHGHTLDGQFDRLAGPHDKMARAEFIAVGFDHGPLDAVRVQGTFNGKRIRGRARDDWQEGEQAGSDCENVQHCPDLLPEHYDTFSTCFGQEHSHEQAIPHTSILITSCDFQAVLLRHQYCTEHGEPAPKHNAMGGSMARIALILSVLFFVAPPVFAESNSHGHAPAALQPKGTTAVTLQGDALVLTFGPIDLPAGHSGNLASSLPIHSFKAPKDMTVTGFRSRIFTKDGKELPGQYLHHILLQNLEEKSLSCPGEPTYFAGAGIEITDAKFPPGYGVPIKKDSKLVAIVAFYHKVPPTKDVIATFTMDLAPDGATLKPIKAYTVGVNVVCYSQFSKRPPNESDEGRELKPGVVQVDSKPLKFTLDGCIKYAYPHGHDGLLMIALDNKTMNQTLLRSVPDVENGGNLRGFLPHQIYSSTKGFPVNTKDDYEMTMVYHLIVVLGVHRK